MNYGQWYRSVSAPFRGAGVARAIGIADRALVALIALAYIGTLIWLAITADARLVKALAVPTIAFALVTMLRQAIGRARPYEQYDIDPIIAKDTRGKSMPSRHVASAVVIACTLTWLSPAAGLVALLASAVVAFTRIIGGVHFPSDVLAAIALSLICAFVGFIVIP